MKTVINQDIKEMFVNLQDKINGSLYYKNRYAEMYNGHLSAGASPQQAKELALAEFEMNLEPPKIEDILFIHTPVDQL